MDKDKEPILLRTALTTPLATPLLTERAKREIRKAVTATTLRRIKKLDEEILDLLGAGSEQVAHAMPLERRVAGHISFLRAKEQEMAVLEKRSWCALLEMKALMWQRILDLIRYEHEGMRQAYIKKELAESESTEALLPKAAASEGGFVFHPAYAAGLEDGACYGHVFGPVKAPPAYQHLIVLACQNRRRATIFQEGLPLHNLFVERARTFFTAANVLAQETFLHPDRVTVENRMDTTVTRAPGWMLHLHFD